MFVKKLKYIFVGPAECLFQESYFNLMKTALRPGGIVCSQAGTAWMNLDHVVQTFKHCKSAFSTVDYCIASVPSYPTGQIGFVLGGLGTVRIYIYIYIYSYKISCAFCF